MDNYRTATVELFRALTFAASASHVHADNAAADVGQSLARWTVLDAFSDGPRTVPAAARRLRQSRQSIQRLADLLVGEGLVERSDNPDHRRSPLYEVTTEGESKLVELADSVRAWHSFVGEQLRVDEIADMTRSLIRLREIAEAYQPRAKR